MRLLSSAVSLACALLLAKPALADARVEAAAQSALKKAATDYRGKHYVAAAARLEKAARSCGDDKCLSETKAELLRDLGTMLFRHGDTDAASKSFADALALKPDLALDPRYESADLQMAWDDAKKKSGASDTKDSSALSALGADTPPAAAAPPTPEATPSASADVAVDAEQSKATPRYARFWVGIAGSVDFLVMPSGTDLCKLTPEAAPANTVVAYCTNPDGTDFPTHVTSAQNDALVPGREGNIRGGLQLGDVRAMLAFDYALSPSILVGARAGYVMNSYTGYAAIHDGRAFSQVHLHTEVRGTYLFGPAPLSAIGFAPMVFAGGGMSEFDGSLAGGVGFNNSVGTQRVNIWVTDGPWFLMVGGGFRYQFSLRAAFTGAVRVNAAFPGNGVLPTVGPEIAFQYGL